MDPKSVLGVISHLYANIEALIEQNAALRAALAERDETPPGSPPAGTSRIGGDDYNGM